MTLQKRINELFDGSKYKPIELAQYTKLSRAAISAWMTGTTNKIAGENAFLVAKFFGVNAEWVQTGKGEKYPTRNEPIEDDLSIGGFDLWDEKTPLREDEVALPFFREVELSAGKGISEIQQNYGSKLRFSKLTLKRHNVDIENAACVVVTGNSMDPVIPNGSTIGIDTSKKEIKDSDIYAIDHDGSLRIKIIYKIPGGGLRLRSFNNGEWPDEIYNAEAAAKIRILGRVFWWSVLR